MKVTFDLSLPDLEPGGTSESKESRRRRKRFRKALRDLDVHESRHVVPILEALLGANAHQLDPEDLSATCEDWLAIDLRRRLVRDHAYRAQLLSDCLVPLLRQLEQES